MTDSKKTKRKGRPLLVALAGAAAFKALACSPYPPGNLIAPPQCPDGGFEPCEEVDGGAPDGGTDAGTDGGTDGG